MRYDRKTRVPKISRDELLQNIGVCPPLRSPFPKQPGLHALLKTRPPPCLHPHNDARRRALSTCMYTNLMGQTMAKDHDKHCFHGASPRFIRMTKAKHGGDDDDDDNDDDNNDNENK